MPLETRSPQRRTERSVCWGRKKPGAERLLKEGFAGAPAFCSLTLLVKMKGHVGGGSGLPRFQGVVWSVKAKPVHMSYYISTVYVMCRNWLLEVSCSFLVIPRGRDGTSNLRV